jgi:aspartate-semialdehyde dehydrogenase
VSKSINVAVLGATGLVGETLIQILEEREFPVNRLFPLASARSVGRSVTFRGEQVPVLALDGFDFGSTQLGLFSPGASISKQAAPRAVAASAVVIDNTSAFRYDDDIPLIVPEVNPERIADYTQRGIIANPNCSTIQMLVALKPIHDHAGIERINLATYQAVSGAGGGAVETLLADSRTRLAGEAPPVRDGMPSIAFDAVPQIDVFLENGYTKEEMKIVWETRKILGDNSIMVNPTAVRVPVLFGHSEAVHIETRTKVTVPEVQKLLNCAPGVTVMDDRRPGGYPTAVTAGAHQDAVFVGRIREDLSHPRGIDLWIVSDNVRKGAALNTIQIAEILLNDYL